MNPLKAVLFTACLVALSAANHHRSNKMKPSEWFSSSELQSLPAISDITLEQLERMPLEQGAQLAHKLYHLSQINYDLVPSFVPSPSSIPVYIVKSNGKNITANLNNMMNKIKQVPNFAEEELTIFLTGLPQHTASIAKADQKLVEAYIQRYNVENYQYKKDENMANQQRTSSEEDEESWKNQKSSSGNLVVIDLGSTITTFKRMATLDVEQTGNMIGKALVDLTNQAEIPQEIIHIVAQGIGAHVAGAAARQYTRLTGQKMRRITALDPSKVFAKNPERLTGLARGDAEFVDAIHTSANGMGTRQRVGDVDFYPNGLSYGVIGADNVVEASMRATRYYAETVRPGNERNFPAVAANSLEQYKKKNGHGKRAYMGVEAEFDLEGDYMLEVNPKSPFGKSARAEKQNTYHGVHQAWKSDNNDN